MLTLPLKCPECGSKRIWKAGLRYTNFGDVQRYFCRDCGFRFSDPEFSSKKPISQNEQTDSRQICVTQTKGTKNLVEVNSQKTGHVGATNIARNTEPKYFFSEFPRELQSHVITYAVKRLNHGSSKEGVSSYVYSLRSLVRNGATLDNPSSVKSVIYGMKISNRTKNQLAIVYDSFLKHIGKTWDKPKYRSERKIPSIPLETELDQLIGGTSKTISTFLQILKETGGRLGEIARIKWKDIDFKRKIISINYPEKGSDPRQVKVSSKLLTMIDRIPRKRDTIFACKKQISHQFYKQRKRLIQKLGNPNLARIGFHSFRHWHGTMLYHKTKNLVYVQERLGHRNIKNTRLYVKLINFESDEYHSATAKTIEDACKLIDTGFEYVCDFEDVKLFRKRK